MGRTVTFLAVAAMVAVGVGCGREPAEAATETAAERWLRRTEAAPDQADLVAQLRQDPIAAETVFIHAFNNGPPEAEREAVVEAVEWHWAMLQVQIAEPEAYGLSNSEIEAMKSISLSENKSEALLDFDYSYKEAALTGLAITQGQAGRQLLDQVAADPNSTHRSVAIAALKPRRSSD
jgi:hypothetical protein